MLNQEKIRMMARLSIFEKREGRDVPRISRYYKADYISNRILRAALHYSLCFLLVASFVLLLKINMIFESLNPDFLLSLGRGILLLYLLGLSAAVVAAAALSANYYDRIQRLGDRYLDELERLLELEEAEDALPASSPGKEEASPDLFPSEQGASSELSLEELSEEESPGEKVREETEEGAGELTEEESREELRAPAAELQFTPQVSRRMQGSTDKKSGGRRRGEE